LASCFGLPAASQHDLASVTSELAARFPLSFSRAFDLCPLRLEGNELFLLVHTPLSRESSDELRELFGLTLRPLSCHPHALTMARNRVYQLTCDARTLALETRLARRRQGMHVREALERISISGSFSAAAGEALAFAGGLIDFAVFLRPDGEQLRIAAGGGERKLPAMIAAPEAGSTLAAALRHRSYFMGPVAGGNADERFFASLGRAVPRSAFVAPVPSTSGRPVLLYADNGPLGMAPRWLAELTLVVARLGQRTTAQARPATSTAAQSARQPAESAHAANASHMPPATITKAVSAPATSAALAGVEPTTEGERAILKRLQTAAEQAGLGLEAFVDKLLGPRAAPPIEETTVALMGEVHGLFERLATAIPAQLALGMQNAFRDIVPRLAAAQPAVPAARDYAPVPAAAASVGLVMTEAKPREVPSYDSRRRKAAKMKL
jgi:hypothetical protein